LLQLKENTNIFEELEKLAKEQGITYGLIVSGFGKIKKFDLVATTPGKGINRTFFEKAFEVNAMSGKISIDSRGKFSAYLRISATSTGFTPMGGQLMGGVAAEKLEIGIRKIDTKKIIEA